LRRFSGLGEVADDADAFEADRFNVLSGLFNVANFVSRFAADNIDFATLSS